MPNESSISLPFPIRSGGSNQVLSLDSTLQELPLYTFSLNPSYISRELAQVFEKHPLLPGAVLQEDNQFVGMLSRHRFLESLIRPYGLDLFFHQPMAILYSYIRTELLILPNTTPIVLAAQQALRRPPELLGEPIVVQAEMDTYALLDVHELNIAYWQIRGVETQVRYERTQAEMIQSDKMASLGRLVDGIAHEVLDPVGFIWGNLTYVNTYSQDLMNLLAAYEVHIPNPPAALVELREEVELDFIRHDFLRSIESIKSGAERLTKLATSLQNFCYIDAVYPKPADLHELLDSILLLLKSRLTSEIEVVKNYGYLPPVLCFSGQLNQVFMNIIGNAVGVLLDRAVRQKVNNEFRSTTNHCSLTEKPRIEITTEVLSLPSPDPTIVESRWVSVRIANNGPAILIERQQRILESFTIAQRAAKETSLSVSYQIVTAKHGGQFKMRSPCFGLDDPDCATGTEFEILLPLT
ncbi:MAG: ATP-binding protein [Leptolyngbyaceae cyanobacterium bins.59]|nr:ATP-binding protein [Leptolyngbyaceae cyanobacterium bins.59]